MLKKLKKSKKKHTLQWLFMTEVHNLILKFKLKSDIKGSSTEFRREVQRLGQAGHFSNVCSQYWQQCWASYFKTAIIYSY